MGNSSSTIENVKIGARLRQVREEKGASQQQFAEVLGISLRGYQNYERGERTASPELIRALWSTFGTDPVWLLTGEGVTGRRRARRPDDHRLRYFRRWLEEWEKTATVDERTWFDLEMRRAFPDYAAWLVREQADEEARRADAARLEKEIGEAYGL